MDIHSDSDGDGDAAYPLSHISSHLDEFHNTQKDTRRYTHSERSSYVKIYKRDNSKNVRILRTHLFMSTGA